MTNLVELANAIEMAVAPAFILTGVGAILTVMATRLARSVDRFRILKESNNFKSKDKESEMRYLLLRAKYTHWAITFVTIAALLLCILIASIFIATEIQFNLFNKLITLLFIATMAAVIIGLLTFLKEVSLSKNVISIKK